MSFGYDVGRLVRQRIVTGGRWPNVTEAQWDTHGMEKIMGTMEVPGRYPTGESIRYLNGVLNIDENSYCQDWEFEVSDPDRLKELLDVYDDQTRSDDDRFALMTLIVDSFNSSYNPAVPGGFDLEIWNRIEKHLLSDFQLHQYTILYWCLADIHEDEDRDYYFYATPLMRTVWNRGVGGGSG